MGYSCVKKTSRHLFPKMCGHGQKDGVCCCNRKFCATHPDGMIESRDDVKCCPKLCCPACTVTSVDGCCVTPCFIVWAISVVVGMVVFFIAGAIGADMTSKSGSETIRGLATFLGTMGGAIYTFCIWKPETDSERRKRRGTVYGAAISQRVVMAPGQPVGQAPVHVHMHQHGPNLV